MKIKVKICKSLTINQMEVTHVSGCLFSLSTTGNNEQNLILFFTFIHVCTHIGFNYSKVYIPFSVASCRKCHKKRSKVKMVTHFVGFLKKIVSNDVFVLYYCFINLEILSK